MSLDGLTLTGSLMMRMKQTLLGAVGAVMLACGPAAYAADFVNIIPLGTSTALDAAHGGGSVNFNVSNIAADGSITAKFDHQFGFSTNKSVVKSYQDQFTFTLPDTGTGSGSVSTNTFKIGSLTDLNFDTIDVFNGFNHFAVTHGSFDGGATESGGISGVPIFVGQLVTLTISGTTHGAGFYNGSATFTPVAAVPEPGTWAIMMLGFGMAGMKLRSRKPKAVKALVAA